MLKSLLRVETNGAKIDAKMLSDYSKELGKKIEKLSKQAFKMAGEEFNMDSPKQLVEILFNKLELPVLKKTPKGQPSTNEDTLQRLAEEYDLPKVIIEYRGLAKLKSTYTDSLTNIQHPSLNGFILHISKLLHQQEGYLLLNQIFRISQSKHLKAEKFEKLL